MGHCHDGLGEDHLEMWTQLGYKYSAKLPEPDRVGLSRCIEVNQSTGFRESGEF